jgi:undecaprenyl-diphosphatase
VTLADAIILGVVEGLTEYLPVSSTGHLIVASRALRLEPGPVDAYLIVIQFGAILAVMAYYHARIAELLRGASARDANGLRLLRNLVVAFLPAAIVGLALDDIIEAKFFNPTTVAIALIAGGVAMIAAERWAHRRPARVEDVDAMAWRDALWIGCAQCLALWPGMSRSMTTIVGAQLRGLSTPAAAEFSFLLALPTLGAATVYRFVSAYRELQAMEGGLKLLAVGNAVSFAVAFAAVWGFLSLVKRFGMAPWGWYRIAAGAVLLILASRGFFGP